MSKRCGKLHQIDRSLPPFFIGDNISDRRGVDVLTAEFLYGLDVNALHEQASDE